MPNVKITKYVQIIYIIFSLILFISFFILPSIGLKLRIDKFGCDALRYSLVTGILLEHL